jgi:5-methylcytosine-specific restriction protein A
MIIKWSEEELKLLLSYYRKMSSGDMHKNNALVKEVSEKLRNLSCNKKFSNKSTKFRNPNGVALKLANFLYIDPRYKGKGMKGCSNLDKLIFNNEFKYLNRK